MHTTWTMPISSFCCMIFPNRSRNFNLVFEERKRRPLAVFSAFRKTECHSSRGRARAAGTTGSQRKLLSLCCLLPCLLAMQKAAACRHQVMEDTTDGMMACRLHRCTTGKGTCHVAHTSYQHLQTKKHGFTRLLHTYCGLVHCCVTGWHWQSKNMLGSKSSWSAQVKRSKA